MALIGGFVERPNASLGWRTEVECGYAIGYHTDGPVLHLETYGSQSRQIPGKVSQSLELDESAARELMQIIRRAFPRLA